MKITPEISVLISGVISNVGHGGGFCLLVQVLSEEIQFIQVALLGQVVSLVAVEDVAAWVVWIAVDMNFMRDLLGQKVAVKANGTVMQEVLVGRHDE